MKKIVKQFCFFSAVFILFLLGHMNVYAGTASLQGPNITRAGETLTLNLMVSDDGVTMLSGKLKYDASQVTLLGVEKSIATWEMGIQGDNILAEDKEFNNPLQGLTNVMKINFKVNGSVKEGNVINISLENIVTSTADAGGSDIAKISYSATVAAPLSGENNLSALNVSNATISPAFNAGTTSYTANVPFSVSKLDVTATAKDSKAKVSINSPNLVPNGNTNVTVTVTAENGAAKTYTIKVFREQDPNYVASNNNTLSGITVNGFLLSPVFSPDRQQYIVWLPYETETLTVSGTPADPKASVEVVGGDKLFAGQDNEIKVICTAEDGTKKTYLVIAKRAAAHDGSVEEIPDEPPVADTEDVTESTENEPSTENKQDVQTNATNGVPVGLVVIIGFVALGIGAFVGYINYNSVHKIIRNFKNKR